MNQFSLLIVPPYHPHLPVLFLHQMCHPLPHQPLRCPVPPVKAPPADWENAVVRFQRFKRCFIHDGFCQFCSYGTIYTLADLVYLFFIHGIAPSLNYANRSCPVCSDSILMFGIRSATHNSGRFALTNAAGIGGHTALPHRRTCSLRGYVLPV